MERRTDRGREKSRPERRGGAGIIGKRRPRGGEAVWGKQEKIQRDRRGAGGGRRAFNFLTEALAMRTSVFSSAHWIKWSKIIREEEAGRGVWGARLSALAATPQRGRVKSLAIWTYSKSNPVQLSAPKANTHTDLQWQLDTVHCLVT